MGASKSKASLIAQDQSYDIPARNPSDKLLSAQSNRSRSFGSMSKPFSQHNPMEGDMYQQPFQNQNQRLLPDPVVLSGEQQRVYEQQKIYEQIQRNARQGGVSAESQMRGRQQQNIQGGSPPRRPNDQNDSLEMGDDQEEFADQIDLAIIQSIFEQEQNEEEEKMLREVMKLSTFEYQKQTGQIDLSHLKRQQNKKSEIPAPLHQQMKANGSLAPVIIGSKKPAPPQQEWNDVQRSISLHDPQNHKYDASIGKNSSIKSQFQIEEHKKQEEEADLLMDFVANRPADPFPDEDQFKREEPSPEKLKKDEDEFEFLMKSESPMKKEKQGIKQGQPQKLNFNQDQDDTDIFGPKNQDQFDAFDELVSESVDFNVLVNNKEQPIPNLKSKREEIQNNQNHSLKKSKIDKGESTDVSKKNLVPKQEDSEEDEFDQLIGHMDKSHKKEQARQQERPAKEDQLDEDFF